MTATAAAALYIALFTLVLLGLGALVVRERLRCRVGIGDGQDPMLRRVIRVHGNAAEQAAPTIGILIGLALLSAPVWSVHLLGAAAVAGRVFHAAGMMVSEGVTLGRQVGMVLTWTSQGLGALALLALALT